MNYDTIPSLPRLFFDQAQKLSQKPFLWRKDDSAFKPIRWNRVAADVRALARGLIALGVKPGDRVALIAENRPEWLISDLAIMSVGAITVPAFSTNTVDDNRHVLTHSGARGVIISNPGIAKRVLPAAMLAPELNFLIAMESLSQTQQLPLRFLSWSEAMSLGDPKLDADIGSARSPATRPAASSTPRAPAACPRA
jgi:long-chain acyl-CoA synthetase